MALERLRREVARQRAGHRAVWTSARPEKQAALKDKSNRIAAFQWHSLTDDGGAAVFVFGVTALDADHLVYP